ncbi:aldo/keto reductase [Saccharomonospora piscinae]|uniref:aldo/keto reductase n=1 Tax=Saccharomonospora piscinae TaxID=687388 RepID=UPI0004630ADA|nr:aldo/keto reductase [Saccharomonospora piscinae]
MTTTHLALGEHFVRRIGLGTMRYADSPENRSGMTAPVWSAPTDRHHLTRVLRHAVDLGVTLFDTADAYALGEGERLLGEALSGLPDDLVVATKVGVVRPAPEIWTPLGHPDYLRQQIELSLRRLGREVLDLVYLHRIDPSYPLADQVGALADAVKAGKVRAVGLSEVTVEQVDAAREVMPVSAVQNHYNLVDRVHEDVLDATGKHDTAFVPFFPLSFDADAVPALADVAREVGATPRQVALAWLLRQGPHVLPIPGTTSGDHVRENVEALDSELSTDLLARLTP